MKKVDWMQICCLVMFLCGHTALEQANLLGNDTVRYYVWAAWCLAFIRVSLKIARKAF